MSGTSLREQHTGPVHEPGDPGYHEARALFNAMIDAHPAAIAQCATVDDVRAAVRYAREHDTPTAVRAGGHSVAGMSTVEDGLVIDVRNLKGATVDPAALYGRGDCKNDPDVQCFDRNRSTIAGGISVPPVPFQNRPTFQQTVEVTQHLPR